MLPKPESACFMIADISGYTSFLAGVELDHAQDIIADVMDTVLRRLRPPFGSPNSRVMRLLSTRSPIRLTDRCSRTPSSQPTSPFASGSATLSSQHPASAAPAVRYRISTSSSSATMASSSGKRWPAARNSLVAREKKQPRRCWRNHPCQCQESVS